MALDSRTGEEEEILDQRVTDGVASGQDHPPLHHPERISLVRNRMREICASGSVGGEGGNALAYPAIADLVLQRVPAAAKSLQQGAMIAPLEDRQLWPVLFIRRRALLITAAKPLSDARIEPWQRAFEPSAHLLEGPS